MDRFTLSGARGRIVVRSIAALPIAAAAAVLLIPALPASIQAWYAGSFYPRLQALVTGASNAVPFALLDVLIVAAVIGAASLSVRTWRAWRRSRSWRAVARGLFVLASAAAALYLWFAIFWGFNYDRAPVSAAFGFDEARVTPKAVVALGARAVDETNARYDAAHAHGFPGVYETPAPLLNALHEVERRLGRPRPSVPGRPKRTIIAPFFRASGTDGLTAPFFLETLLNPDLTPAERPIVLAHEWAHLSGRAPESEASFVAVVAAVHADVASQYSAWLALTIDVASRLPAAERGRMLARLAGGPRRDWERIAVRQRTRVHLVEAVSWLAYDRYLRSQGVDEGVVDYSRVIELLIGTGALGSQDGSALVPIR